MLRGTLFTLSRNICLFYVIVVLRTNEMQTKHHFANVTDPNNQLGIKWINKSS